MLNTQDIIADLRSVFDSGRADEMRRLRFEEKWSITKIGVFFGVSRQRVHQILGCTGHIAEHILNSRAGRGVQLYGDIGDDTTHTNTQLADIYHIPKQRVTDYRTGLRHPKDGESNRKGAEIEQYISDLLTERGIAHTLTNSAPHDIILADGSTVEIKSRHTAYPNKSNTKNFYYFPMYRKSKRDNEKADFYILVIVNGDRSVFVIPQAALPKSMALGFCWPQTNKSRGKWTQYLNRFDLLKGD